MTLLSLPWPTVLASASPRRQLLLHRFISEFEVDAADLDEEALIVSDPVQTAERLALEKALLVATRHSGKLIIGGDTVVAMDGRQFGKPTTSEDAIRMLTELSGREHEVISALALVWPEGRQVYSEVAQVRFRALAASEIEAYVASGEPMDKAGAYAIQGGARTFVASMEGELETVIGMPIVRLAAILSSMQEI